MYFIQRDVCLKDEVSFVNREFLVPTAATAAVCKAKRVLEPGAQMDEDAELEVKWDGPRIGNSLIVYQIP